MNTNLDTIFKTSQTHSATVVGIFKQLSTSLSNAQITQIKEKRFNYSWNSPFWVTTFLEISNWFWITLCHAFQLFSYSVLLYIYIKTERDRESIFNAFLNVYQQGYVVCNLFFLIFFIFYCPYHIHIKNPSFLRYFKKIPNLLFWVIWACMATHT